MKTSDALTWQGHTRSIAEWASMIGVSRQCLLYRLNAGWSLEEALTKTADRRAYYASMVTRKCTKCGPLPVAHFNKYRDDSSPEGWRYYSRCRECNKADCRSYGKGNRPKRNARLKRWRKNKPDMVRLLDRRRGLASNYALTPEQAERVLALNGGRCCLCQQKKKLSIDHCHTTGRIRGPLCSSCNLLVGHIEAIPGFVQRVGPYLAEFGHPDIDRAIGVAGHVVPARAMKRRARRAAAPGDGPATGSLGVPSG